MTETIGYDWDNVNLDGYGETVTEADVKKANATRVPGSFVVVFEKPTLGDKITKDFKNNAGEITSKGYMSFEIGLKMTVIDIIALDKPVLGGDGKQLERNGEPATRIMPLTETEKAAEFIFYEGMALTEDVRMVPLNPEDEKVGTKNRRIKIADAIGILAPGEEMSIKDWLKVEGKKCVVHQVWNTWTDKQTNEKRKNIKIDFFNGFEEYVENSGTGRNATDPKAEEFEDI